MTLSLCSPAQAHCGSHATSAAVKHPERAEVWFSQECLSGSHLRQHRPQALAFALFESMTSDQPQCAGKSSNAAAVAVQQHSFSAAQGAGVCHHKLCAGDDGCLLSRQLVPLLASNVRRRIRPRVPAGAALDPCTALTGMPKAFSSAATIGSSSSGGKLTPFSAEVIGAGWALRCFAACCIHPGASGNFGAWVGTACRCIGACKEAARVTA